MKGKRRKEEGKSTEEGRSLVENFVFLTSSFILYPSTLSKRR